MKEIKKIFYRFEKEDVVKLKKWLIDNDLNMSKLAKKMGVSSAYISAITTGKRNATPRFIKKLKSIGYEVSWNEIHKNSRWCVWKR